MSQAGYYRFPCIRGDRIAFTCDDDLWTVSATGGTARRLTAGLGLASNPHYSPDGRWLAFTSRAEGQTEVYVMPAEGGEAQRLTYLGPGHCQVIGWDRGQILFASAAAQPFRQLAHIYRLNPEGGLPEQAPIGSAMFAAFRSDGACVLCRNGLDPARWKRYRGGTAGDLWIDPLGDGKFRRLVQLKGNPSRPMWIGQRVYFLCDHEQVGNLYSCRTDGGDLKRHTQHRDFYVRNPSTDGRRIVYHAGADLYLFDPATNRSQKLAVEHLSPRTQRNRRFVPAEKFFETAQLHPQAHLITAVTRGKLFTFGNWEGPVLQHGETDGVRYQHPRWLNDGKRLVVVSDAGGEPGLEIHDAAAAKPPARLKLKGAALGRPVDIKVAPQADQLLVANHRHELLLIDLPRKTARILDRSLYTPIGGMAWSPDGRWAAYGCAVSRHTMVIKLCELKTGQSRPVTEPVLMDMAPAFDPEGKYLYFLSYREFDPVYDSLHFDLGFPFGSRPYLVPLQKDQGSPFVPVPRPREAKPTAPAPKGKKPAAPPPLRVDWEGITQRILPFPVPDGKYVQIEGIKGKALFTSQPVAGALRGPSWFDLEEARLKLEAYDFEQLKTETVLPAITQFSLGPDRKTMTVRIGKKLRVLKAGERADETAAKEGPGPRSGWVDLDRLRVAVNPGAEWKQMLRETWRLQRDHFWNEGMSAVNWLAVYKRYAPLVERVSSRDEMADLIWEMQGELGTSHAYELGGDHRAEPSYPQGLLGADLAFDRRTRLWRIEQIIQGDAWDEGRCSPLARPGVNARNGDTLLSIGGQRLSAAVPPQMLLVHRAGTEVQLTLGDRQGRQPRTVTVKPLGNETQLRYRAWVERNRANVHRATGGQAGYVHIPDMGPHGYAEFHRYFLAEIDRTGLVVDVRFNGGGHVSQLILEKLARRRIAYVQSRWMGAETYPADAVGGPLIAITNEYAGSDGDIFSHCFKLLKLGTLVGKRTWGGVVGIWPRHALVDGGLTTQPEFSFWFTDVGWQVENYGTEPDLEVEMRPQDYVAKQDPQLGKALDLMRTALKKTPKPPAFGPGPKLGV